MTIRQRLAPCGDPFLYAAENVSLYHAREEPKVGQEHSHDDVQIALPLDGSFHVVWQTAGGSRQQQRLPQDWLSLSSSGQPHGVCVQEETELAVVWIPAPVLARTALDLTRTGFAELTDTHTVQDDMLWHLCLNLVREARHSQPGRLYMDSMANLLAVHLVRHHSTGRAAKRMAGGLPPRMLRRVTDYVWEHLDQDVSLADLAEVADLSESRFSLLFQQSTGMSPYQYVLSRRIEQAKGLLSTSTLSLGEIALQVGFCDQSQFTRQFKKHAGVTPKVYAHMLQN